MIINKRLQKILMLLIVIGLISLSMNCNRNNLWDEINQTNQTDLLNLLNELNTSSSSYPIPGNSGVITLSNISSDSITLNWTKAADSDTPQSSLQYSVFKSTSNNIDTASNAVTNGTEITSGWTSDINSVTATGLSELTTYYFNVIVMDEAENQAVYIMNSTETLDASSPVPGSSGAISTSNILAESISLTWTKAVDIVTIQTNLQYRVFRSDSNNIDTVTNAESNGTEITSGWTTDIASFDATGLAQNTTYYFNVIVVDEAGYKSAYTSMSDATISYPVGLTGQTKIYETGDDGTCQAGIPWTYPRFTDNGDDTVTDNFTGLMWERVVDSTTRTWAEAITYCENLATGGYTDWRLPNIHELQSLINRGEPKTVTWMKSQVNFSNYYGSLKWTSTTCASATDSAWRVNDAYGSMNYDLKTNTYTYSTFAVRGDPSGTISLPKTDQTTSYAVGDDGVYQKGIAWPSPRFTDNGDGTIIDNLTGLMWQQAPDATKRDWATAITYVEGLAIAGYSDWRLPNVNELRSLLNYGEANTAAWLNAQGFSGVMDSDVYYSSNSSSASDKTTIDLNTGVLSNTEWYTNSRYVMAVRGGPSHPTISANIIRNCQLESGFHIGTASSATGSVALVEVSYDGGAYATATGTTTWSHAIPSGGSTWMNGSEHTICVRSRDDAGNYSVVIDKDIRKATNKDVNGDGYADVGVGATDYSSKTGRAYIFHGSSSGISATADTTITGEAANDELGRKVTFGDLNGDGYADFIIYATYNNTTWTGQVYIFYGGPTGIASANAGAADTIITSPGAGCSFGISVAVGDVNGDGYADLGAAADASTGRVYIFHGVASWGSLIGAASADTIINGEAADIQIMGYSIDFGDINGDGIEDIAMGAPWYNNDETGRVYIFHGSANGIADAVTSSANTIITGEAANTKLGESVVIGHINWDSYADLAIGAPMYNTDQGRVYIFHGASGGIATGIINAGLVPNTIMTGAAVNYEYGKSLAMSDVNSDGYMDLAVGAPKFDNDYQGYTYIYPGENDALITTADFSQVGGGTWYYMGYAIGFCDTNGDGYGDLISSQYGYSSSQGLIQIYNGSSSGASGTASATIYGETLPIADSRFGYSITP